MQMKIVLFISKQNVYSFEFCSALWNMGTSIIYYFMPFFYQKKVLWGMLTSVLLSRRAHICNVNFQIPWNFFFHTEMGSRALFCASFKLCKSGFLFRFLSEDEITSNKNLQTSVFNIHIECFRLLKQITFIFVGLDGKQFSYITCLLIISRTLWLCIRTNVKPSKLPAQMSYFSASDWGNN